MRDALNGNGERLWCEKILVDWRDDDEEAVRRSAEAAIAKPNWNRNKTQNPKWEGCRMLASVVVKFDNAMGIGADCFSQIAVSN